PLVCLLVDPFILCEAALGDGLILRHLGRLRDLRRNLDASEGFVVEDGGGLLGVAKLFVVRVLLVVHDGSSTFPFQGAGRDRPRRTAGRSPERPHGALAPSAASIGGWRKTRQRGAVGRAGAAAEQVEAQPREDA